MVIIFALHLLSEFSFSMGVAAQGNGYVLTCTLNYEGAELMKSEGNVSFAS